MNENSSASQATASVIEPPEGGWTALIDDVRLGRWRDPVTGELSPASPFDAIRIEDSLDGAESDLIAGLGMSGSVVVVSDRNTHDVMGARVAKNLGGVDEIVLDHPHADLTDAARLAERLRGFDHVVAVGSGTLNDLCKFVTSKGGRKYCVFATAASMNGYTSTTASMALESGLKVSLAAHAPAGVFIDLGVSAKAPPRMTAAGFGDGLCRSVSQIDWWMSHRLLDTFYTEAPYRMAWPNEQKVMAYANEIGASDKNAIGYLQRTHVFFGLGVVLTGVSNHGSMGEHQISHYIDCFAGDEHPGTLHGEQVGVATLTMARLQQQMLASETPPVLQPTRIDSESMVRRMGASIAAQCEIEYRKKALDDAGAEAMNAKLADIWQDLRLECAAFAVPDLRSMIAASGCPTTAEEAGLNADIYREAVRHGHEMRNRFSFVDLACDSGCLDDFVAGER